MAEKSYKNPYNDRYVECLKIYRKFVDVEKSFDAWIMFVNNFNLIFIFIYIECQRFCLRVDVVGGKTNLVFMDHGEFHDSIKFMSEINKQIKVG